MIDPVPGVGVSCNRLVPVNWKFCDRLPIIGIQRTVGRGKYFRPAMGPGIAMPEKSGLVEQCVERLCRAGCSKVYGYISQLEEGCTFPEVAHLSATERSRVHDQLVSIMKVYDGKVCDD